MRLLSITVRNYRVHRDLTVTLDPARTLIGGPNESGKSTLAEAAHRALFLRARVTGEAQKSMVSHRHPGHPEVEVSFEVGGHAWRVAKRFSGASGTATLSRQGGETWQQEEAEAKLSELLGVEEVGGGRGVAERAAGQWGHLWVRQGQGGDSPSTHATEQRQSLLARLQEEGGAVAMESDLDSRIAATFSEKAAAIFNLNGKPKANSDLDRANRDLEAAEAALESAREKTSQLRQAAEDHAAADRLISEKTTKLSALDAERSRTEARLEEARQLAHRVELEKRDAEQAASRHQTLRTADRQIAELGEKIQQSSRNLAPQEAATQQSEADIAARKERRDLALGHCRKLDEELRGARARLELAKAWRDRFDFQERHDRLAREQAGVASLRAEVRKIEADLARLPQVTTETLTSLQRLDRERSEAAAALEAMAAGITLRSGSLTVRVGGEALPPGEARVITEETEIEIGDDTRLAITPGGGNNLSEARHRVEECCGQLGEALETLGIASLGEAATFLARRQELAARIDAGNAELRGKKADTVEGDLAAAADALAGALAEVERRSAALADASKPENAPAAGDAVATARSALEALEAGEPRARADADTAERALRVAESSHQRHLQSIAEARTERQNLEVRLRALEETHGTAAERGEKLARLASEASEAAERLSSTGTALAALQPETLQADAERHHRALDLARKALGEAEQRRAVARDILSRDGGGQDPAESLALAEAACESARRHQISAGRKARAVQMLADCFAGEQRALAHQFTRPLAEKVAGYLQQLLGPGTMVDIELNDGRFEKLMVSREGSAFDFDDLSGGTREQVAAAFRLAMAEILAADHDGCLPVVFDDAFTHSDPQRVITLQRMLDLAARRGLQVILLTCAPSDYTGLGAATVTLG